MALVLTEWADDGNPTQANDSEGSHDETDCKSDVEASMSGSVSSHSSPRRILRKLNMKCMYVVVITTVVALLIVIVVMVAALVHNQGRPGVHEVAPAYRPPNCTGPTAAKILQRPQTIQWVQLALDILRVPNCKHELERAGLPCKNKTAYITPESQVLSPLRCVDDAHHENRTRNPNTCAADSDTFQLLGDAGRVRVRREGVFLLIAQVTVRMAEAAQVHFGVAVNKDHLALLCTVQSYGVSRKGGSIPYSHCSVKGLRHLNTGDEVWLFVSHGGVPLQSLYRSTFLQIALLGDGRMPS